MFTTNMKREDTFHSREYSLPQILLSTSELVMKIFSLVFSIYGIFQTINQAIFTDIDTSFKEPIPVHTLICNIVFNISIY
jgi:hypothetical protein